MPRPTIATGATLFIAVFAMTRLLGAETNGQHQSLPPSIQPATVSEDREALMARLTKILNYSGDYGGLGKPGKADAVIALGLLGDERAVPVLIEHLVNEENKNLRLQIVRSLGWIGSQQAVPALEQTLQDKYPLLRKQAADVLKTITGRDYEYDKTGLPDFNKMRELIRASAKESS
jgi:HEAT repeat protein